MVWDIGLPLAVAFSKKFKVVGYDVNKMRVEQLKRNYDKTNEIEKEKLKKNKNLIFINNISDIKNIDFFVITVPTPIKNKKPDLKMIIEANKLLAKKIKKKKFCCLRIYCVPRKQRIFVQKLLRISQNLIK